MSIYKPDKKNIHVRNLQTKNPRYREVNLTNSTKQIQIL